MAQDQELIEAYTVIGEKNARAWEAIDGAMAGLVKILTAYRRNQQKVLRRHVQVEREHRQMQATLAELLNVKTEHQQILAMLGDIQEHMARLEARLESREQAE